MAKKPIHESTISFEPNPVFHEAAWEVPTHYRVLGREPRTTHPFWTYEDIFCQPEKLEATLAVPDERFKEIAQKLKKKGIRRLLFSGVGSSLNLAMAAAHAFWQIASFPADWVDSSEALIGDMVLDTEGLAVVGLSASGNTLETVEHIRACREKGCLTLAFVNTTDTRLVEAAEISYVDPGGFGILWETSVRLAAVIRLAAAVASLQNRDEEAKAVLAGLQQMPALYARVLPRLDVRSSSLGELIAGQKAAVIAGSGNQSAIVHEMALRFMEMAFFPVWPDGLVNFLHGCIGFLTSDVATILIAPGDRTRPYARRLAQITQVTKSPLIAVIDEEDRAVGQLADGVLRMPQVHAALKPLLYLLPAQLLPYYTSIAIPGGNPDIRRTNQPRFARAYALAFPPKSH
ncbi:MAG: SIS domain-containing protein [Anaerolineales bacterium]|nr:SIS domain-containing protein [Anaerolineales bacterium]